jgi:hypothetical protein
LFPVPGACRTREERGTPQEWCPVLPPQGARRDRLGSTGREDGPAATGEEELTTGRDDADDADGGDVTGGAFSEAPPKA